MHAFDRWTDGQTDRIPIAIPHLHSMQRGKNRLSASWVQHTMQTNLVAVQNKTLNGPRVSWISPIGISPGRNLPMVTHLLQHSLSLCNLHCRSRRLMIRTPMTTSSMFSDLVPGLSVPCKSYHTSTAHCWSSSFMALLGSWCRPMLLLACTTIAHPYYPHCVSEIL